MKKSILFIVIAISFSSCISNRIVYSEIEPDIEFLKQKIEDVHPDPYWFLTENQFDSLLLSLKNTLSEEGKISQKYFFQQLNPIIAQLQDGHTRLRVPSGVMLRAFLWGSKIMPVAFKIEGKELYLRADLRSQELFDGSVKVLTINGISSQDIIENLLANNYGFNANFRVHQLNETSLTRDLWLFFDMNKRFKVEAVCLDGEILEYYFKGISQPKYYSRLAKINDASTNISDTTIQINGVNGSYYEFSDRKMAVIKYRHFGGNDRDFIDSAFNQAKVRDIEHLILDLRGNRGGTTSIYETIVSHLTRDTITMFSNVEFKLSRELLDIKPFGQDFEYPDVDTPYETHFLDKSLLRITPSFANELYKGRFYVLMDGGTFSTASGFCAMIKDNGLGMLIGEPSGGIGSSFGNFVRVQLPNSKIPLEISTSRYYRPNGCTSFSTVKPNQHHEAHFILNALHQFIPSL